MYNGDTSSIHFERCPVCKHVVKLDMVRARTHDFMNGLHRIESVKVACGNCRKHIRCVLLSDGIRFMWPVCQERILPECVVLHCNNIVVRNGNFRVLYIYSPIFTERRTIVDSLALIDENLVVIDWSIGSEQYPISLSKNIKGYYILPSNPIYNHVEGRQYPSLWAEIIVSNFALSIGKNKIFSAYPAFATNVERFDYRCNQMKHWTNEDYERFDIQWLSQHSGKSHVIGVRK
jgi:hypothetical protein